MQEQLECDRDHERAEKRPCDGFHRRLDRCQTPHVDESARDQKNVLENDGSDLLKS